MRINKIQLETKREREAKRGIERQGQIITEKILREREGETELEK
jgi:hypothetical protein